MSDPLLEVDADGHPVDLDAVVAEPAPETWLVKPSEPRWQVWRDHNRRRPPTRAEKRGRVAAATAGTIIGVLTVGGALSYAIQWQGIQSHGAEQLRVGGIRYSGEGDGEGSAAQLQANVDLAANRPGSSQGLIGIVNGVVVASTPNASGLAADAGFVRTIARVPAMGMGATVISESSYTSLSSACVYDVMVFRDRTNDHSAFVKVVDLTGERDRLNLGYLAYGLVGLGVAGLSGGAVWWGLGRKLNRKVEPEDV